MLELSEGNEKAENMDDVSDKANKTAAGKNKNGIENSEDNENSVLISEASDKESQKSKKEEEYEKFEKQLESLKDMLDRMKETQKNIKKTETKTKKVLNYSYKKVSSSIRSAKSVSQASNAVSSASSNLAALKRKAASGNYDAAIARYTELAGYADSDALCRASRYEKAVAAQEAGDYAGAMALFADAGQYADSMARLRECCKQQGISIYYFSADAVNAGVDTGYAKQDTISGDDKHFGWRLGRFFLTGFTRVTADENQQPVFIKTLGDSVTLWFDLEQDIDALNGNAQLSLAADANGYDQQFGIPKTNFGRGTLIVRHTDYQNAKNEPAVYTDYLLAKGTTGANTRIVLHEEGDYEVALDYEVQDSELTHITSKFGNYRIFLRFSIRNGNCMVYPFDLLTGAELQNTAVAEAGFSLDLARSRYLDINVRRAVLVETANGVIEDERFNRPAKDGDRYTQEGIYIISVSNRYTGESTTKTIFVGSQELLETYVRNGFSLERLK